MKILLIGSTGQVGWELKRSLAPLGQMIALGRQEADLTQPEVLERKSGKRGQVEIDHWPALYTSMSPTGDIPSGLSPIRRNPG